MKGNSECLFFVEFQRMNLNDKQLIFQEAFNLPWTFPVFFLMNYWSNRLKIEIKEQNYSEKPKITKKEIGKRDPQLMMSAACLLVDLSFSRIAFFLSAARFL